MDVIQGQFREREGMSPGKAGERRIYLRTRSSQVQASSRYFRDLSSEALNLRGRLLTVDSGNPNALTDVD